MNQVTRNQALYLMDGLISLEIEFNKGGQTYQYLALAEDTYEEGDLVLVPHVNLDKGFRTVKVVAVHNEPDIDETATYEHKFVVGRVNTEKYDRTLAAVAKAVECFSDAKRKAKRAQYREAVLHDLGEKGKDLLTISLGTTQD